MPEEKLSINRDRDVKWNLGVYVRHDFAPTNAVADSHVGARLDSRAQAAREHDQRQDGDAERARRANAGRSLSGRNRARRGDALDTGLSRTPLRRKRRTIMQPCRARW
jgi:hypothetical protein